MTLRKIAVVTEKASGHRYEVYAVQGDHDATHAVWARNGYACRCPWKQHHPQRRCKHMLRLQVALDDERRAAPLYREDIALVK